MPNTYSNLTDLFTAIANQIRDKKGYASGVTIKADDFPSEISGISTGVPESLSSVSRLHFSYGGLDFTSNPLNVADVSATITPPSSVKYYLAIVEAMYSNDHATSGYAFCLYSSDNPLPIYRSDSGKVGRFGAYTTNQQGDINFGVIVSKDSTRGQVAAMSVFALS